MNQSQFFKDLKVIELANILAGPAVGLFFAELGAEVIKIENKNTQGDTTRKWKLAQEDPSKKDSAYYHSVNWNKLVRFLDLKNPTDYLALIEEIKTADVVITNYKSGSAEKLKVDYKTLSNLNPRLIYAGITAYGDDDPRPGFDVVIQAETGWLSMNGEAGGAPVKLPVALMDILAAHQLKEAILLALLHRFQTGKGSKVSISLFDTGLASLANQASNYLNEGYIPRRTGSQHANIAPYGDIYYTRDKKPIIVAPGTQKQFENLCLAVNQNGLISDPLFTTNADRLINRAALNQTLQNGFAALDASEVLKRCTSLEVPIAMIRNLQDLFELPSAQALILESKDEQGQPSKRVRTAVFKISSD